MEPTLAQQHRCEGVQGWEDWAAKILPRISPAKLDSTFDFSEQYFHQLNWSTKCRKGSLHIDGEVQNIELVIEQSIWTWTISSGDGSRMTESEHLRLNLRLVHYHSEEGCEASELLCHGVS